MWDRRQSSKKKTLSGQKNVLSDPGPGDVRRCFKKGRGILKFESAAGETLESKLLKVAALFPQLSSPLLNAKKNEEDDYFGLDASAFIRLCKDFEGRWIAWWWWEHYIFCWCRRLSRPGHLDRRLSLEYEQNCFVQSDVSRQCSGRDRGAEGRSLSSSFPRWCCSKSGGRVDYYIAAQFYV